MIIFHVEKTKDYTVMSNHHLRDKRLSLKAKGRACCRKSSRSRKIGTTPYKGWLTLTGSRLTQSVRPFTIWNGLGTSCGQENGTAGAICGERSTPSTNSRNIRHWKNRRWIIQCWKTLYW